MARRPVAPGETGAYLGARASRPPHRYEGETPALPCFSGAERRTLTGTLRCAQRDKAHSVPFALVRFFLYPWYPCYSWNKGVALLTLILTWIVSALSLIIITRLDVGVSVRSFDRALVAALVIGLVNAVLGPILGLLALPLTILSVGLFALIINALLFWLAAAIVSGFYLRNGFWSALIGSLLLSLSNAIIFWILGLLGIG